MYVSKWTVAYPNIYLVYCSGYLCMSLLPYLIQTLIKADPYLMSIFLSPSVLTGKEVE